MGQLGPVFHAFTISPEPNASVDTVTSFLNNQDMASMDRDTALRELSFLARIENPKRHSPLTMDCASCHLAGALRERAQSALKIGLGEIADRFVSTLSLQLTSQARGDLTSLRAFGYLGAKTAISQRTVNETAAVLEAIQARWAARGTPASASQAR